MTNAKVIYKTHPSAEWYTPRWLRELALEVFGGVIDLDPCTHRLNPLGARAFYTRAEDGLAQLWPSEARTIWCNPPYGRETPKWSARLAIASTERTDRAALLLVPARPGAKWYRQTTESSQIRCELDGRVSFDRLRGRGERMRIEEGSEPARWGNALFYWGPNRDVVARIMRRAGLITLHRRRAEQPADRVLTDARQAAFGGMCSHCSRWSEYCARALGDESRACCEKCSHITPPLARAIGRARAATSLRLVSE